MRKIMSVFVLGLLCTMFFASCKDSETCDAYDAGSIQEEVNQDQARK